MLMKPSLTKFRIAELIFCVLALAAGLLYLWAHLLPLAATLPFLFVCFSAIPVCRYLEGRHNGMAGIALWLPVIAMGVIAGIVLIAWIAYLAG